SGSAMISHLYDSFYGSVVREPCPLPAVVGEGLVGLGHPVHVLTALDGRADAVGGVEDLVGQPFGHGLLAALPGEPGEPTDGQGGGPPRADLHRHLVGGATDPAALDLELRPDVLDG